MRKIKTRGSRPAYFWAWWWPAGPRWGGISQLEGARSGQRARGRSEACLLGSRLCLPVSWEMRLLLRTCTSCRSTSSQEGFTEGFMGGGGGRGAERASCFSLFLPNSSAGLHMFNMQGAVSGEAVLSLWGSSLSYMVHSHTSSSLHGHHQVSSPQPPLLFAINCESGCEPAHAPLSQHSPHPGAESHTRMSRSVHAAVVWN